MHARGLEPLSEAQQESVRAVFDAAIATLGEADQQVQFLHIEYAEREIIQCSIHI